MLCNCLQASAAGAGDFKLMCMSCTLRRNIRMFFFVFFFNSNICNLSSKRRLFLEAYLWGYSFLSFLLVFFNEINLLYVYSLNKDNTVCNAGEPCAYLFFQSVMRVELDSQWPYKQELTKQSQYPSKWTLS